MTGLPDCFISTLGLSQQCSGIDTVRNTIKMFAQQKVTLPAGRHKIIILDEADRLIARALHMWFAHTGI